MSREVLGDADEVAGPPTHPVSLLTTGGPLPSASAEIGAEPAAAPPPAPVMPEPATPEPEPPAPVTVNRATRGIGRSWRDGLVLRLAVIVLLLLAGGGLGWQSYGSWQASGDLNSDVAAVTAAVSDTAGIAADLDPTRARLTLTVVNGSRLAIRVVGYGAPSSSVTVMGLDPPGLRIPAGQSGVIAADVAVRCSSATQLALPDLRIRTLDGGQRPIRPAGGVSALTQVCSAGPTPQRPLVFSRYARLDDRLGLVLLSPTGRPARVLAIRAGGVGLPTSDLPVTVTGEGHQIVLAPLGSCPQAWRTAGVPTRLEVDLGTVGSVDLELGLPLATWVMQTSCPPDRGGQR